MRKAIALIVGGLLAVALAAPAAAGPPGPPDSVPAPPAGTGAPGGPPEGLEDIPGPLPPQAGHAQQGLGTVQDAGMPDEAAEGVAAAQQMVTLTNPAGREISVPEIAAPQVEAAFQLAEGLDALLNGLGAELPDEAAEQSPALKATQRLPQVARFILGALFTGFQG